MGVWVKGTGYGAKGKRHYYESDETDWAELRRSPNYGITWREWMVGRPICSGRAEGHGIAGTGKAGIPPWRPGNNVVVDKGLSIKYDKDIKLTQANLCYYCKTRYIKSRPELEAALKELGVI